MPVWSEVKSETANHGEVNEILLFVCSLYIMPQPQMAADVPLFFTLGKFPSNSEIFLPLLLEK